MSTQSFGKYLFILVFVNLLIKPLYLFGIETQAQNLLGTNTWGLYFGLLNFCFLFQIILDPGIHNQNTKWVAENRANLPARIGETIILKLWMGLIFLILLALIGSWMSYPTSYYRILGIIGINFFLSSFYIFIKSHFPAMGDYAKESFYSILDKLLLIVILGVQIYVLKDLTLNSFILSITAANVIAIIIAFTRLRKFSAIHFQFKFGNALAILRQSFGFALVGLFMSLFNRMDGVMLQYMVDDNSYSSGVYAAGYRILDASNMFALLFASLLLPMFAYKLSVKDEIGKLAFQAAQIMLVLVCLVTLTGYFYAEDIMDLLYTHYTQQYADSFRILILSFIGVGFSFVYGTLITATGRLFIFNLILFAGICVNWYLNYQWIPLETCVGAAKASLITQVAVMACQYLLVLKEFGISGKIKSQIAGGLYIVLAVVSAYFIHKLELHWIIRVSLSAIIMIIASFLLGLIRLDTFNSKQSESEANYT